MDLVTTNNQELTSLQDLSTGYFGILAQPNKSGTTVKSAVKNDSDGLPCRPFVPCLVKDVFEVERSSITLGDKIGRGGCSQVRKGVWKGTIQVAVKLLTPGKMTPEEFLGEAERMKILRHPNLLTLLAVVSEKPIYIVTEYMPNGNLFLYLREGEGQYSDTKDHIEMATQIASGMYYLETMSYFHRDLRAANVLVGNRGTYKIADFGLSRKIIKNGEYQASPEENFPYRWSAPECFTHSKFSIKSDVWSYGVLLYELVTHGREPYEEVAKEKVSSLLEKGYRLPQTEGCPDIFYNIMMKCWKDQAENRPCFCELRQTFRDLGRRVQSST